MKRILVLTVLLIAIVFPGVSDAHEPDGFEGFLDGDAVYMYYRDGSFTMCPFVPDAYGLIWGMSYFPNSSSKSAECVAVYVVDNDPAKEEPVDIVKITFIVRDADFNVISETEVTCENSFIPFRAKFYCQ